MQLKSCMLFVFILVVCSCAIGPIYLPELQSENSGLNMKDKKVLVTKFYKAETNLSYLGDFEITRILESAKLSDISFSLSNFLGERGINSTAMKDAPANSLKKGEVMLSGSLITRSIPMEENFPYPGMLVLILIGNLLPSPSPYISGVDVIYRYELIDSSGRILFQSPEKSSRILYKDHYIWGRFFNYKKYERKIKENLQRQIFDQIIDDLFQ